MDYKRQIQELKGLLEVNKNITLKMFNVVEQKTPSTKHVDKVKHCKGMGSFYKTLKEFSFEWSYHSNKEEEIYGSTNIIDLDTVLQDWEGNIYFDDDCDSDDIIRYFHPFDLFVPEAKVGLLLDEDEPDEAVFVFDTDDLLSLDLNFKGYFTMLLEAKGFIYWQRAILSIIDNEGNYESEQFKKHMPKIFPEFKWEDFVAKYEAIRLSNQS